MRDFAKLLYKLNDFNVDYNYHIGAFCKFYIIIFVRIGFYYIPYYSLRQCFLFLLKNQVLIVYNVYLANFIYIKQF